MNVRTATPSDIPGISRLIQKLAQHDGVPAPEPQSLQDVLSHLMTRGSTTYLVAENDEGELVGSLQLDFRLTTWEAATYVYLEDFFVEEEYRGRGVGSVMLDLARTIAQERGCVRIELDVLESSAEAQRFYVRHGFADQYRRFMRLVLNENKTPA